MKSIRYFMMLIAMLLMSASGAVAQSDSLVTFTGTLINSRTQEPVPGMSISYKKLPYETEMGYLKTDNNGKFTAYFRAASQYSLLIESEGYIKVAEIINPLESASDDLIVNRTFNLHEGGVGSILRLENLQFARGEAAILDQSYGELNNLFKMLEDTPNLVIRLEGHTDYVGNPTANLNLSQLRVDAVKKYLTDKGIDPERVQTKAFGGTQPIVRSTVSNERAANRRVEVRIVSDNR